MAGFTLDKVDRPTVWRQRSFMAFCLASFLSNAGGWMQAGAVPYIVLQATGSVAWVGLAGFVAFLPSMLCTLPGGLLADRFDRRRVLIVTQMLMAVVTLPMCIDALVGDFSVLLLLVVLGLQSALLGLGVPSFQTLAPALVDHSLSEKAINLNSAQAQLAKALGPLLAGVTLAHMGVAIAFIVNAATFVVTAAVLAAIHRSIPAASPGDRTSPLRLLKTGMHSTWQHPTRRVATVLVAIAMFLGTPVYQSIAAVADGELRASATTYGVLVALYGVGAVLGNVVNHFIAARTSTKVAGAVAIFGAGILLFAGAGNATTAGAGVLLAGCGYLLVSVTLLTRVQVVTPNYLRGRVVAVYSLFYIGGVPLGNLVQGWTAERFGVGSTLTVAGVLLVTIALAVVTKRSISAALDDVVLVDLDQRDADSASAPYRSALEGR